MDKIISTVIQSGEAKQEVSLPEGKNPSTGQIETNVEEPYTEYEHVKGHPYSVEYFKLGDTWDIFTDEVQAIESYIKDKITNGDIANTKKSVEKEIKAMERMNNIKDEERSVVKLGILSSYIKFMTDSRNIKRYANY